MNLLALSDYFTENLPLLIVIIVIAVLLAATVIAMIVLGIRAKKNKQSAPVETEASAPVEEKAPAPVEEDKPTPAEEAPAPVEEDKPAPVEEDKPAPVEKTEQPKPAPAPQPKVVPVIIKPSERLQTTKEEPMEKKENVKKPEPVKKTEPAKSAPKPAAPAKKQEPAKVSAAAGKWVIEAIKGKYWLSLIAPNGQVMLESPTAYASLSSARSGIKTYQENIAAGRMEITEHKNGDSQVQILNGRGLLLATSSTYSTRTQAESALGSIKRWSVTEAVEVLEEKK